MPIKSFFLLLLSLVTLTTLSANPIFRHAKNYIKMNIGKFEFKLLLSYIFVLYARNECSYDAHIHIYIRDRSSKEEKCTGVRLAERERDTRAILFK